MSDLADCWQYRQVGEPARRSEKRSPRLEFDAESEIGVRCRAGQTLERIGSWIVCSLCDTQIRVERFAGSAPQMFVLCGNDPFAVEENTQ